MPRAQGELTIYIANHMYEEPVEQASMNDTVHRDQPESSSGQKSVGRKKRMARPIVAMQV
ncbi:MAG: hypothetical protein K2Z81_15575 [Cyanobacteria bacterium]|nr:hypothetical protein [Cyanobacteriota bacterium]